jgi:tetratricopeptide (TPR) repeat protein
VPRFQIPLIKPGVQICCTRLSDKVTSFRTQRSETTDASSLGRTTLSATGNVKLRKGDLNGAMADSNQAIQLNPKFGLAYRNRGNAKKKKGDIDGAIADNNRAIQLGVSTTYYSD